MRYLWILLGLLVLGVAALLVLRQMFFASASSKMGRLFSLTSKPADGGDPDALRFEIMLERITRRNVDGDSTAEHNSITVTATDGRKRRQELPGTEIRVNDVALRYGVGVGNYYDRYPHFKLADERDVWVQGGQLYSFTFRGTNAVVEPLAEIHTPPPLGLEQLQVPVTHPRTRDLEIAFKGLQSPVELVLFKTYGFTDEMGNHGFISGSANDPEAWRKTLQGSGRVSVPATYFRAPPGRSVAALDMEFRSTATGKVHPPFSEGSQIQALRKLEFHVELTDR